jgi:outer membrane receptor for monomeric catechols
MGSLLAQGSFQETNKDKQAGAGGMGEYMKTLDTRKGIRNVSAAWRNVMKYSMKEAGRNSSPR